MKEAHLDEKLELEFEGSHRQAQAHICLSHSHAQVPSGQGAPGGVNGSGSHSEDELLEDELLLPEDELLLPVDELDEPVDELLLPEDELLLPEDELLGGRHSPWESRSQAHESHSSSLIISSGASLVGSKVRHSTVNTKSMPLALKTSLRPIGVPFLNH